jgi:HlyD family secretion protein
MSDPATTLNNNREPRRRPWIWLGLIGFVVVATVLAAVVLRPQNGSSAGATEADPPNLTEVVMTDLTQEETFNGKLESIKGSGTLVPASQIELSFASPGTVADLLVQVGQEVRAGDVLARVNSVAALNAVTTAELQLAQVAMQSDATTTQSGTSFDEISVAQAQINLDVAQQASLGLLNWEADADDIAQLEANVAAAEAVYDAALGQKAASSNYIAVSNISVAQAERQLANAQAAYDTAFDPAREWESWYDEPTCYPHEGGSSPCTGPTFSESMENEREGATVSLQYAQENLQIAQLNYAASVANASNSGSANAESQLLSAEQALATALAGPSEEQKAAAETAVQQALLNLQQAHLNREAHELGLAQAELTLAVAQDSLAGTTIIAPMDGTIMSINGHLGGQVGTAPFIKLADLSQPTLEIFLDETNLDKVGIGSKVEVVFSALPTERLSGTVVQVDPQLIDSGGLSFVRALVQLDSHHDQTLPAGLNAAFNVAGLSNRIVRLFLPLDDEGLLAVGDPVNVELPDLSAIPGTVVFVPQAPTPSNWGPPAFEVLVEIDDPGAAAGLAELADETSVDVIFISDAVDDVMAIPVSALVALLEGGYAVEVDTAIGGPRLVAVEVGFFGSNNMIAVTSDGLRPGDRVLVP